MLDASFVHNDTIIQYKHNLKRDTKKSAIAPHTHTAEQKKKFETDGKSIIVHNNSDMKTDAEKSGRKRIKCKEYCMDVG